ncbi:MAG: preprotein translocase subunit SecG [Bacteroidetes bacterium]|jgi:preprotein translocase subunit SecG|nr:preprotein translocase subunit SecG [Bacteroidota bacterium]MBT3748429.1 preprotein translocase subunit SecG [Bacteroidota bacterium]MBT4398738.1 preprotein translocase subunit SecG [Bacteroidota bacterium]MBT4411685.1 preprotein translocase subunit SecG [Bacteroidota bacterium]MBT5424856.1 preprotein translocase subunit SecG [Bacteroidota bacterium]
MYVFVSVFIVVVGVLLTLIVLVQNSKGGGLASNFSSSNQMMGVRKTTDFLEKSTWILAIALLVLSLVASMTIPRDVEVGNRSAIEEQIRNAVDPSQIPEFPSSLPQNPTAGPDGTGGQE